MNESVIGMVLSRWVVGDILLLSFKVLAVADSVFVIATVPDFAWKLLADGEGKTSLDELDAAGGAEVLWSSAGVMRTWIWSGMMTKAWTAKRP